MSALALFSELSDRGIRVKPNGQDVTVSPKKSLTPDLVKRIKSEKPALIRQLKKIRRHAGADWDEIHSDPRQLKAYCEMLMVVEMRERGQIPDHYTGTTTCSRCGPVPIWDSCPPYVDGCPWCFNRIQGLSIPAVATE